MNALALFMKHRVKIFDIGFVLVILSVFALFVFEFDVFLHRGQTTYQEQQVEIDELLILSTLVVSGALFYTWRRAREHRRENDRRIEAEAEVLKLALQDPLTGLPNRRRFDEALKSALSHVPAAPEAHALLLLDLNGFKKINDLHGHPVGDQALIHVGARLLRAVRDRDLVARLGGDEFAVLVHNAAGAEGATNTALRVIEGLASPVVIGGVQHHVGAAIGVALSPHDGCEPEELLRKADVALYRAKAERRSTVRFFEPAMDAALREREELERALMTAIGANAVLLRFQPVHRGDGRIVAFEAQPRWPHASGELGPDRFFPIAEETGWLGRLVEQLLRKGCATASLWPSDVRLHFNLPGALLTESTFGLRIMQVLAETALPPRRLGLEIDEGALFREAEAAQAMLAPLRRMGVTVTADHFGTGYSDLKNLRRLELDAVKIDRSYVAGMTQDRKAAVMVKAMIGIGQGLDLVVMADGVANEQQRAALAAQGCDQAQGGLYGVGLSADDALAAVLQQQDTRPWARSTA